MKTPIQEEVNGLLVALRQAQRKLESVCEGSRTPQAVLGELVGAGPMLEEVIGMTVAAYQEGAV